MRTSHDSAKPWAPAASVNTSSSEVKEIWDFLAGGVPRRQSGRVPFHIHRCWLKEAVSHFPCQLPGHKISCAMLVTRQLGEGDRGEGDSVSRSLRLRPLRNKGCLET